MFMLMIGMMVLGLLLLVLAPLLARLLLGGGDHVAATRILQVVGAALLIGALLVRPHSTETSAFPGPPDQPSDR